MSLITPASSGGPPSRPGMPEAGHRGQPVWRALAVLVVLPLLAAAVMAGVSVSAASREADQATGALRLVKAVELLDAVRRAVDAEVLPSMLVALLQDEQRAAAVGFDPTRSAGLRVSGPARLDQARARTDQALTAADAIAGSGIPALEAVLAKTRTSLLSVRAVASGADQLEVFARDYAAIAVALASAQRRLDAEAISSGLSTDSVAALQDLDQVVQLSETASRQLAMLFASRVLNGPSASDAGRAWLASWGTYTQVAQRGDRLSGRTTAVAWSVYLETADLASFSAQLDRQALDPRATVLETAGLPSLAALSRRRDDAIAVVLEEAVTEASAAAARDRDRAVRSEQILLGLCVALVALSLLNAGLLARWLAGSMQSLASSARQVSLGHLVDVAERGPRELRTAARALSAAVAGLRRVQEQALAVVDGDLEAALRHPPLPGPLGEVVHASVEQIVDAFRAREALQAELAHQANHDALTGLPNRAQTLRELSAALRGERRADARTGVLFIDLDGFKAVNDTHGHAVGDALLREVATRLSSVLRNGDTVGRLGGDEFVITVAGIKMVTDLLELARRLIEAVSRPMQLGEGDEAKQVSVGASVGAAMSAQDSTADALLAEADHAAYRAKHLGRGRVEVYDEALRAELADQRDRGLELRTALEAGDLSLHYQPLVELATGQVVGYEALARWERPGRGAVGPDVFIPVAEASTLVCDLGRWALVTATTQLARWRELGRAGVTRSGREPTIGVNVSGRHLRDAQILDDVAQALSASGLPAHLLVLEVSETAVGDNARARRHLQALRELGVLVAMDGFGTGKTPVGELSALPADLVKIDRSLVGSTHSQGVEVGSLLARAARTFGVHVVAVGIETPVQLSRARADGCQDAQGYLFARPLPASEVEQLPDSLSAAFAAEASIPPSPTMPAPRPARSSTTQRSTT